MNMNHDLGYEILALFATSCKLLNVLGLGLARSGLVSVSGGDGQWLIVVRDRLRGVVLELVWAASEFVVAEVCSLGNGDVVRRLLVAAHGGGRRKVGGGWRVREREKGIKSDVPQAASTDTLFLLNVSIGGPIALVYNNHTEPATLFNQIGRRAAELAWAPENPFTHQQPKRGSSQQRTCLNPKDA
ncbi:hypothetical protein Droror1_Dr00000117 [Drosera rotundifolia]